MKGVAMFSVFPSRTVPSPMFGAKKPNLSPKEPFSVAEAWQRLPNALKDMLGPVVNRHNMDQLVANTQSPQMGILEEASDILYESFVLVALETGAIKESLISRTQSHILASNAPSERLQDCMKQVKSWMQDNQIDRHQVESLARLTDMPVETAETLLALTYLRLATLRMEGRFAQARVKTQHQLQGEFWELMERLPEHLKPMMGHSIVNGGYRNMHRQFPDIQKKLVFVLANTLGENATPESMYEYTRYKHYLRQGIRLHYLYDGDMDYDKRKRTSKAIEALVEAALLKRLGN